MAYKTPSGLMGQPEDMMKFETFKVEDIQVHIHRNVLLEYLKENKLLINIEGYGKYNFEILNSEEASE